MTGHAHIMGTPVSLLAHRRDGTTVEVELTISQLGYPHPTLVAATLRAVFSHAPLFPLGGVETAGGGNNTEQS